MGVSIGTGCVGATYAHGKASGAEGRCHVQTRSGHLFGTCSTGSSPSPSDATTYHLRPDQNQSRQRAVLHTSVCTVLACLDPRRDYTPRHPSFCPHAYRAAVWSSRQNFRDVFGSLSRPSPEARHQEHPSLCLYSPCRSATGEVCALYC
jgi:hypothetical protein